MKGLGGVVIEEMGIYDLTSDTEHRSERMPKDDRKER